MTIADIQSHISFLTKTNTTSFPSADRLIMINDAYRRVVSLIMRADGRWEWDDTNQTDLPVATTAIVASQQDYTLATAHIGIKRVEIKQNGASAFTKLLPIDQADSDYAMDNSTTGTPLYYDLSGPSIFLYPIPDFSQSASLKVYYDRGPAEYTSDEVSTGTKEPGFASLFHSLLAYWPAYNYAVANGQPTAQGYMAEIQRLEDALQRHYGHRDRDDRQQITMRSINFR